MGSFDDQVKRKRARTGCLKCRSRRRKCDEEKPACRRCRDSGFQCKYGTKLSFLEKNAITLPSPSSPGTPSVSAYRNLQFVEPPSSSLRTLPKPSTIATTPSGEAQTSPSSTVPETGLDLGDGSQNCVLDDSSPALLFNEPLIHNQLPLQDAHQGILLQNTRPSGQSPGTGAYQTARVLLSLGNNGQSHVTSIHPGDSSAQSLSTHPSPDFWSDLEPFASCRHAPQSHVVRFLRHYVYSIAPWLDTGDPDQTFRARVSQLCLFSQPVLDSLLELSSTSLLARSQATQVNPLQLVEQISHYDTSSPAEAVALLLACVRIFILTEPFSWILPQQLSSLVSQHSGLDEGGSKSSVSVSWLLLRLSLSRGLIHGESIEIPDMLLHSVSTPSGRGWSRDLLDYDRQPLLLCAKALNYCFPGQDNNGGSSKPNTVEAWKKIFNSLDLWYSNRPQDFKPVLELEGHGRRFPLLLFTNSAAVMANQMYHTAMLLLLQHRPRTIAAASGRTASFSPLRHAQRICGIGLNNADENWWDFALVSSLFTAAKRMTYVPQQDAILQKFDQIEAMTGWNLKGLAPHLKQIWNPVS